MIDGRCQKSISTFEPPFFVPHPSNKTTTSDEISLSFFFCMRELERRRKLLKRNATTTENRCREEEKKTKRKTLFMPWEDLKVTFGFREKKIRAKPLFSYLTSCNIIMDDCNCCMIKWKIWPLKLFNRNLLNNKREFELFCSAGREQKMFFFLSLC